MEKAFITAEELKQFCAELCCEEYPIPETMDRDVEEVEKHWPKFAEPGPSTGGNQRHGGQAALVAYLLLFGKTVAGSSRAKSKQCGLVLVVIWNDP